MSHANPLTKTDEEKLNALTQTAVDLNDFKAAVTQITANYERAQPITAAALAPFNNIMVNKKIPAPQKFNYCNFLIKQKIYPNILPPSPRVPSPVFLAVLMRDVKIVKLLLEQGAPPDALCQLHYFTKGPEPKIKKRTVPLLFVAEIIGNDQCAALLLNYGADVNARDSKNLSILGYVVETQHKRISYDDLKEKTKFYCEYGYKLKQRFGPNQRPLTEYVKYFLGHNPAIQTMAEYKAHVKDWENFSRQLTGPERVTAGARAQ